MTAAATPSQNPGQPDMTLDEALNALAKANSTIADLQRQLVWFKRAMFGRKSERRIDIPKPGETLFDAAGIEIDPGPAREDPPKDKPKTRSKRKQGKKNRGKAVNEAGLRFDKDVPVETVILPNPAADDIPEAERELVREHVVHKLVQVPSSYKIIRYATPIYKWRGTNRFATPPAPPAVLEGTCAHVSLL